MKKPYIAKMDNDYKVFGCPNIGDETPKGFEPVETYLVDNSGFGGDDEPALTAAQFQKKVKKGFGYAIVGVGQFQVQIGEFKRI